MVVTAQTLRERVHEEVRTEIVELARVQLRSSGPEGLSLRGIARDLELASSAVHRYFTSRNELLTELIISGFNAIGTVAEEADKAHQGHSPSDRWLATASAIRGWALAYPHEYALIYGSPIPGYVAPDGTALPAARDKAVLGRILVDAHRDGRLTSPAVRAEGGMAPEDLERVRDAVLPGLPGETVAAALAAWSGVLGMITLEVFGHFSIIVTDTDAMFRVALSHYGHLMGLEETA